MAKILKIPLFTVVSILTFGLIANLALSETQLYQKAYESILTIPYVEADGIDGLECNISNFTGYALKASEDVTIIGFWEYTYINFVLGFKIKDLDLRKYFKAELYLNGNKVSNYSVSQNEDYFYFYHIPLKVIEEHIPNGLSFKIVCINEKTWFTGKKITKNLLGFKYKQPKYVDGEWKSEVLEKQEFSYFVAHDYFRALIDKIQAQ